MDWRKEGTVIGDSSGLRRRKPDAAFPRRPRSRSRRIAADDDELLSRIKANESRIEQARTSLDRAQTWLDRLESSSNSRSYSNVNGSSPSHHYLCEICFDNKQSQEMFKNPTCTHSYCKDCTASHIIAKIRQKDEIRCPSPECPIMLDFDACRLIIPNEILVQWDEWLCTSLFPESQKLYCPFRDCLATMINETSQTNLKEVQCVACKRTFCAKCQVPWHSEFTCKKFRKMYGRQGEGKLDRIAKTLARKKNWKKCPRCRMFVEKNGGCPHISCRCGHQFCYRCGLPWTRGHSKICILFRFTNVFFIFG